MLNQKPAGELTSSPCTTEGSLIFKKLLTSCRVPGTPPNFARGKLLYTLS